MKRGLIVAPARLTALAVFNSGTLRWQCSTVAHCAGSVQQWHTALADDKYAADNTINTKQDLVASPPALVAVPT